MPPNPTGETSSIPSQFFPDSRVQNDSLFSLHIVCFLNHGKGGTVILNINLSRWYNNWRFYGNTEKEYQQIHEAIRQYNRSTATLIAIFGGGILAGLAISSCFSSLISIFRPLYFISAIGIAILLLILKKTNISSTLILYAEFVIVLSLSIGLAAEVPDERGTVTLILMPLLSATIIDRADRMFLFNLAFTILYAITIKLFKIPHYVDMELFSISISFVLTVIFHSAIQTKTTKSMLIDNENNRLISNLRRLEAELRIKAERDSLSGLLNRASIIERVEDNLLRRKHTLSALCIMDLDDFKSINDTFGHQTGDSVIKIVGQVMENAFSSGDIIGRLGGDEFMFFLQGRTEEQYKSVLNLFLERLKKLEVGKIHSIPCSIGVAFVTPESLEFENLYNVADQALYQAKREGKHDIRFLTPKGNTSNHRKCSKADISSPAP